MRPPELRFLTTRQSAARIGVTVNAIKTWIREAELPALRTPGGHHRIAETDLLAFKARLADASRATGRAAPRILLVDDKQAVLSTLKDTLESAVPDAVVEVATDGYEALIEVGRFRPHLLVLDLHMPRLDGFEVCRRLKALPETQSIRILAITGYPEGGARERILKAGADNFLAKPFDMAEFRAQALSLLPAPVRR